MTFQVLLVELDSVDSNQFILLSFVVFRYLFLPFPFYFRGAGVVPISCVLNLSTSTFFGWISPLEFMVHSIHSCSRTTRRSACHTRSSLIFLAGELAFFCLRFAALPCACGKLALLSPSPPLSLL